MVVSGLMIKGPIGANHAGQYQCQASYYRHKASLQFEIEVKPRVRVLGTRLTMNYVVKQIVLPVCGMSNSNQP